jgi:hypothetical protein
MSDPIQDYLQSLARQLARLGKADADEVLREIESHLDEAIAARRAAGESVDAAQILAGFGPPQQLAQQYIAHLLQGSPPPPGFRALQRIRQQVGNGLYWATALTGYGCGLALLLLAVAKAIAASGLGLWANDSGQVVVLGIVDPPPAAMRELLGWWLLPLAAGLGAAVLLLTRRLLAVLGPLR